MSAVCTSTLSRVLEHLVDVYAAAKEKKAAESAVIQDCKELLKPWPRKKTRSKPVKDDTEGVEKDKEKEEKEEMETMILSEVELMLAKAQKARDVLAKTDQAKERHKTKGPKQDSRTLGKEKGNNRKRGETSSEGHDGKDTPKSGVISQSDLKKLLPDTTIKSGSSNKKHQGGEGHDGNETPQSGVISQSDLKKLLQLPDTSTKSGSSNKKHQGGATIVLNKQRVNKVSESDAKHLKSKPPTVKTAPSARKQYSTSASEIGKHSKRPSSKVTSSYSQKSLLAKSANERARIGATNTNKQHATRGNRTAHNVQILARKIIKSAASSTQDRTIESSRLESSQHHTGMDAVKKDSCEDTERSGADLGNPDVRTKRISQDDEEQNVDEQEDEAPFLLKTDGTKLRVPLHFRRLYNTQEVLINKVSGVISGSEQTAACKHFLDRVNSKLLGRPDGSFSLYEHDMRYHGLKQEYHQLIHTADQQVLALQQVSGETSWQDLYKIKVNLELIHNRSQQLLTEIKDFEEKEAQYCDIIERAKSKGLVTNSNTNNLPSTFFLPSSNQDVLEDIYPQMFSHVKIEYSNLNEVRRLVGLQLELQVLHVEHQVQKLLSEEMLPLLAAMDKNDPGFIQCYRSLYGLLCHRGEQFPTIIVDEVDETESNSDED